PAHPPIRRHGTRSPRLRGSIAGARSSPGLISWRGGGSSRNSAGASLTSDAAPPRARASRPEVVVPTGPKNRELQHTRGSLPLSRLYGDETDTRSTQRRAAGMHQSRAQLASPTVATSNRLLGWIHDMRTLREATAVVA